MGHRCGTTYGGERGERGREVERTFYPRRAVPAVVDKKLYSRIAVCTWGAFLMRTGLCKKTNGHTLRKRRTVVAHRAGHGRVIRESQEFRSFVRR